MDTELISDAVKIGIPSLVALAGTASAVAISKISNRHALDLEIQRSRNAAGREEEQRRTDLVHRTAVALTRLHHHVIGLAAILSARYDTLASEDDWGDDEISIENDARQNLVTAVHTHFEAKTQVLLLGDKNLIVKHEAYYRMASEMMARTVDGLEDSKTYLDELQKSLAPSYSDLLTELSKIYFPSSTQPSTVA
jgi:hypothetical protein